MLLYANLYLQCPLASLFPHTISSWCQTVKLEIERMDVACCDGVSLLGEENRYVRRMPSTTSRAVCLMDSRTGKLKRRWEKVADAAMALGLTSASISYSIKNNKLREGGYLKYAEDEEN